MQRKFNHTFTKSKMNKDLDARLLGSDEYRDCLLYTSDAADE